MLSAPNTKVVSQGFAANAPTQSITGTLSETTLASTIIPGGFLPKVCAFYLNVGWVITNSVDNKILRIKLGGVTFVSQTLTTVSGSSYLRLLVQRSYGTIIAMPANNSTGLGKSTTPNQTLSIDTRVDNTLEFTGQLGNIADTIQLRVASVRYLVPTYL